jgi:hypothetical protein
MLLDGRPAGGQGVGQEVVGRRFGRGFGVQQGEDPKAGPDCLGRAETDSPPQNRFGSKGLHRSTSFKSIHGPFYMNMGGGDDFCDKGSAPGGLKRFIVRTFIETERIERQEVYGRLRRIRLKNWRRLSGVNAGGGLWKA